MAATLHFLHHLSLLIILVLIVRPRSVRIPLIVNQGVFIGKEVEKQSPEEVKFMIDANLIGSFNVIKAALPAMKAREGRGPALQIHWTLICY
ncbi:3-dehydrosphinganine reductase TSC10B [Cardamine amara subsp. amara]|uniref:3-dehydrosphinganine reductase TSC10B n=1 Tax=Cardamine amara subsp. amara TaxID=228776 RepID=A0ABD1A932_CARAN